MSKLNPVIFMTGLGVLIFVLNNMPSNVSKPWHVFSSSHGQSITHPTEPRNGPDKWVVLAQQQSESRAIPIRWS